MQHLIPLIWVIFIICLFLVWFFTHRANHRERMLRIEKGLEAEPEPPGGKKQSNFFWLRLACLVTGLSLGLLIISLMVALKLLDAGGNAFPVAILGFCGGMSMIVAHYLQKNKTENK
ncbi:DUF6249 domain-containing protein [Gynurincola endophyticus]|uniref:DUF6249 domain-containing protein n=1 Tax=Gynurincola endophyticus TaxID=2479004 RepID=UPI000F8DE9E0|nr:DUF6249 domain-containing protein [Gynurincola endophyticus]